MGCSASRLEDEEAVRLCKDRRNFIKQAVEQRNRFAAGHIAYIHSLRRFSHALRVYVDRDEHPDFFSDSFTTPPFTPVKRLSPEISSVSIKGFPPAQNKPDNKPTIHVMRYLKSEGNTSVSVQEWPQSPETMRIDSYYQMDNYGANGFFTSRDSPINAPSISSPYNGQGYEPSTPQSSLWDYFWNPFSGLDSYAYPSRYSLDRISSDDEMTRFRRVREEEGIPELEEDEQTVSEEDEEHKEVEIRAERPCAHSKHTKTSVDDKDTPKANINTETKVHQVKEFTTQGSESVGLSESRSAVELDVSSDQQVIGNTEAGQETPGFTVFVNRRHLSIASAIREIESQFMRICDCAQEISMMLEASRAQYSSPSEFAVKRLNPALLFRSPSSRSSSSRFFLPSGPQDDGYDSSSVYSDDSCMASGSHQSTLDRLYTWEKKLYQEVKNGERVRIAYEKKCMQLRNQDANGDEPSAVDKTRAAIRDLHTQLTVYIHSVESIARRIEVLRDGELHPQLVELIQGLEKMWRTMAECHRAQKRTIGDAKHLFISNLGGPPTLKPIRSAALLELELRGWRAALLAWAGAQRAYAASLAAWIRRCAGPSAAAAAAASPLLSPCRLSLGERGSAPPLYGVCTQWSRLLESVGEARVMDGLDFFTAGMASVSRPAPGGAAAPDEAAPPAADVVARFVWAGMSAAVGALAEYASDLAGGYQDLIRAVGGGNEAAVEPAGAPQ